MRKPNRDILGPKWDYLNMNMYVAIPYRQTALRARWDLMRGDCTHADRVQLFGRCPNSHLRPEDYWRRG